MAEFYPCLEKLVKEGREFILCGDWNIAHKEIDLKNWRGNRKNSGFLPEEREWLSRIFEQVQFVDVFRSPAEPLRQDPRYSGLAGRHEPDEIDFVDCHLGVVSRSSS